ncbi:MAG: hypothetical protein V2A62_05005 [Candidatus Woesearchaeota archaeon]
MEKELLINYAWIVRGKQRRIIIKVLDRPKTPTLIKEDTNVKVSNVSDVLRAMEKRKLVKCINPKEKLGRLYELTCLGKKIREELVK